MTMRTISGAAQHFRDIDPHTAITEYAIRQAVKSGAVPSVKAGTKYLCAIENLEAYFSGSTFKEESQLHGIRAVNGGRR